MVRTSFKIRSPEMGTFSNGGAVRNFQGGPGGLSGIFALLSVHELAVCALSGAFP